MSDEVIQFILDHRFCAGGYCKCGFELHGAAMAKVSQWEKHIIEVKTKLAKGNSNPEAAPPAAEPICIGCGHGRSTHGEEMPYACMDPDMCDCEGFSYSKPAEPAQPAPRTRLEPDGFDYTTGNEVVVNRRVPAQPAGEDLQRDLSDPAYRLEYLKACAKDSDEALEVGVRDVEKAIRTAAQRENEKLRQALADAANETSAKRWRGRSEMPRL